MSLLLLRLLFISFTEFGLRKRQVKNHHFTKEEHTKTKVMNVKLVEATDLMMRCVKSCTSIEQLSLTMDWVADKIVPLNFDDEVADVLIARGNLLKLIEERKNKINGIGDIEELEMKTQTIHE